MSLYCMNRDYTRCTRAATWAEWIADQKALGIPPLYHPVLIGTAWALGRLLPYVVRDLTRESEYEAHRMAAPQHGETSADRRYWRDIGNGTIPCTTRREDYADPGPIPSGEVTDGTVGTEAATG